MSENCHDLTTIDPLLFQQHKFISEIFNKNKNKKVKEENSIALSIFLHEIKYIKGLLEADAISIAEKINNIHLIKRRKSKFLERILKIKSELKTICDQLIFNRKPCFLSDKDFRPLIIAFLVKKYIEETLKPSLTQKSVKELIINPHLATLLGLHKIQDEKTLENLIRFELMQNITRSIVTSWGNFVEKLLYYSGLFTFEKTTFKELEEYQQFTETLKKNFPGKNALSGANFDLLKIKIQNPTVSCYWFQIKSGPNTVNKQMAEGFINLFKALKEISITLGFSEKHEFLIGLTYGNEKLLSSQTQLFLKEEIKILAGKDLWDFLAEKENFYKLVLELIEYISATFLGENFNISLYLEKSVEQLKKEWIRMYGSDSNLWDLFM